MIASIIIVSAFLFIIYCMCQEQIKYMKKFIKFESKPKKVEDVIEKLESTQRANVDYYLAKFEKCVLYDEKEDILEYQEKVESFYDRQFLKNLDMFIFNKKQKTWLYNSIILPEYVSKVLTLKIIDVIKPVESISKDKDVEVKKEEVENKKD